jgi:hypothetical protein
MRPAVKRPSTLGVSNMSTLLDITQSKHKMTLPVGIRVVQTDDHTPVAAIARVLTDLIRGVAR